MAKRAKSILIEKFLHHVDNGLISGNPNSSGPGFLNTFCKALRAIQDGADVDESLRIERSRGGDEKPWKTAIAYLIHQHRERRDSWHVIQKLANPLLESIGEKPLSESRLQNIYREKREDVDNLIALKKFRDMLHRANSE